MKLTGAAVWFVSTIPTSPLPSLARQTEDRTAGAEIEYGTDGAEKSDDETDRDLVDFDLEREREREREPPRAPVPRRVQGGPAAGYNPTLFLYEHPPGGIGLAERIFERRDVLLERALSLVEGCSCTTGCPACVGPADLGLPTLAGAAPDRETMSRPRGRKAVALALLRRSLGS